MLTAVILVISPGVGVGAEPGSTELDRGPGATRYPVLMRTTMTAVVHRLFNDKSPVIAKIKAGAVIRVRRRGRHSDACPDGWMEREGRGFICGNYLQREQEAEARPAPIDSPDILNGLDAVMVTQNRAKIYRQLDHVKRGRPGFNLLKGSMLTVRGKTTVRDETYYETRRGWFVRADQVRLLAPPIERLGVSIPAGAQVPGAIVTARDARAFKRAAVVPGGGETLARWSVVPRDGGRALPVSDGWVRLPSGGYVEEGSLSLVRTARRPKKLEAGERWIAVDLKEQLLHAYEGETLVRVIPCSTGIENNTDPGFYRIGWKRRIQTLKPEKRIRVEDVQWVMYYVINDGFAIHTAYWHDDFGKPASHGCVNLPGDDARWVFEWSSPTLLPEDSERYPMPRRSGTKVVVFRD